MKTICIVRHASSKKNNKNDYARPLNKAGRQESKALAANLKSEQGLQFDKIISSPAIRSFETALIFAKVLGVGQNKVELKEPLYNIDSVHEFKGTINGLDNELNSVLIIGHNPSIENTIKLLIKGFNHSFYVGSAICIQFDVETWDQINDQSGKFVFYKFNRFNPDLSKLDKMISLSVRNEIYSKIDTCLKDIETNLLFGDTKEGGYESEKLADKLYQKTEIITIRNLDELNEVIKTYEDGKKQKVEKKIKELDESLKSYKSNIIEKNDKRISALEKKKEKLQKKLGLPVEEVVLPKKAVKKPKTVK